jgi:hypothetical protein
MARQVIEKFVSDLSGKEIQEGDAWTMLLTPEDGRKNPVRLDISDSEAQTFLNKGVEIKRRGRRPGSTMKPRTASKTRTTSRARRGKKA